MSTTTSFLARCMLAAGLSACFGMSTTTSFLARCMLAAGLSACFGSAAAYQQTSEATGLQWLGDGQAPGPSSGATLGSADMDRELQRADMDRIGTLPVSCHGRRQHGVLYHVRRLPVGGLASFETYALNNDGLVVGYTARGDSPAKPTVWAGARRYELGTPPNAYGVAYGIGDAGAVVGTVSIPGGASGDVATVWYRGTRYTLHTPDFNNPDNERLQVAAVAINRHGTILGNVNRVASDDNRPVVWRRGVPRVLPSLVSLAIGSAINDAGYVVGGSDYPGGVLREHAMMWTPDGRIIPLARLGGEDSWAYDINNKGKIVGEASPAGDVPQQPVLWYRGRITVLPTPNRTGGVARGINEHDQVVGQGRTAVPGVGRAATWYGATFYQLDTLLDDDSRGIVINDALDINDRGQILAVTGSSFGARQPLLLTPRPCYRR